MAELSTQSRELNPALNLTPKGTMLSVHFNMGISGTCQGDGSYSMTHQSLSHSLQLSCVLLLLEPSLGLIHC